MRAWVVCIAALLSLGGCSDLGTGAHSGWIWYDLPYGRIALPPELAEVRSVAALPLNPEYAGTVNGERLTVQLCVHDSPSMWSYRSYEEQTVFLYGRKAVMFKCFGAFHGYDSHFSTMIGIKAYYRPDGVPLEVIIAVETPGAEDIARAILLTIHP
jgi:hypothetical protein